MKKVIETFAPEKSILGICLGHQGIAEVFGGELLNMGKGISRNFNPGHDH